MNGEFSRMTILSSPESTKQPPPGDPANVAFVKGGKRKRLSKVSSPFHPLLFPALSMRSARLATLVTRASVAVMVLVSFSPTL